MRDVNDCGADGSNVLRAMLARVASGRIGDDAMRSETQAISDAPDNDPTSTAVIELCDARFSWHAAAAPVIAIDSLRVAPGERLLLRGPSGSGKSTLLSLLAGIVAAQSGAVDVLGKELGALTGAARDRFRADHIGVIFQMFNLIPYLSVQENVCLPCAFSNRRRERCERSGAGVVETAAQLLGHLRIGGHEMLRRRAAELSVGEQHRVAAARALMGTSEIVPADEPTSSLDSDRRAAFLELLFRECARERTTLIFLTVLGVALGLATLYVGLVVSRPWLEQQFGLFISLRWPSVAEFEFMILIVACGVLIGLIPAYRIYRLSLADGMTIRI